MRNWSWKSTVGTTRQVLWNLGLISLGSALCAVAINGILIPREFLKFLMKLNLVNICFIKTNRALNPLIRKKIMLCYSLNTFSPFFYNRNSYDHPNNKAYNGCYCSSIHPCKIVCEEKYDACKQ